MSDTNQGQVERKKVATGDFLIGEASLWGRIVRNGPEHKGENAGLRIEATILIGLWDKRQKAERERPMFVRVKAFAGTAADAYAQLEACERLDRVAVAGNLILHTWDDDDGNRRQGMELLADHIRREERLPSLRKMFEQPDTSADAGVDEGRDRSDGGHVSDTDIPF